MCAVAKKSEDSSIDADGLGWERGSKVLFSSFSLSPSSFFLLLFCFVFFFVFLSVYPFGFAKYLFVGVESSSSRSLRLCDDAVP